MDGGAIGLFVKDKRMKSDFGLLNCVSFNQAQFAFDCVAILPNQLSYLPQNVQRMKKGNGNNRENNSIVFRTKICSAGLEIYQCNQFAQFDQ